MVFLLETDYSKIERKARFVPRNANSELPPVTLVIKGNKILRICIGMREYEPDYLEDISSGNIGTGPLNAETVDRARQAYLAYRTYKENKSMYIETKLI